MLSRVTGQAPRDFVALAISTKDTSTRPPSLSTSSSRDSGGAGYDDAAANLLQKIPLKS
jgi:hypothetical protein